MPTIPEIRFWRRNTVVLKRVDKNCKRFFAAVAGNGRHGVNRRHAGELPQKKECQFVQVLRRDLEILRRRLKLRVTEPRGARNEYESVASAGCTLKRQFRARLPAAAVEWD